MNKKNKIVCESIFKDNYYQINFVSVNDEEDNQKKYRQNRIDFYTLKDGDCCGNHVHIELTKKQLEKLHKLIENALKTRGMDEKKKDVCKTIYKSKYCNLIFVLVDNQNRIDCYALEDDVIVSIELTKQQL